MDKKARAKEKRGAPRERPGAQERLLSAARAGSGELVGRWIERGADPLAACSLPEFKKRMARKCLVTLAAQSGSLKCLRKVLEALPLEARRQKVPQACGVAAWRHGSEAVLRFLADLPAEWVARGPLRQGALHALDRGNKEAAMVFAAALGGADVIDPSLGDTALLAAARRGQGELAERFLAFSDPLARDHEGNTALMLALSQGLGPGYRAIEPLARACDVEARNAAGQSAFDLARQKFSRGAQTRALALLEASALARAAAQPKPDSRAPARARAL